MSRTIRKGAGAKFSIILLSIFILLFITSSVVFADPGKLGDVNEDGVVDVRDVVLVMRHVLEIEELDEDQEKWADVDGDGVINVRDATYIMQYALGIIDEFPYDLPEVLSVKAIDRTTIEVELSEDVAEDVAEDPEYYEVTVDDEAIDVEDVDYDADDLIAELEVDLEGKSGVLVVNGVEADEDVPPLPEFTGISAVEGSRDIDLYFNTAVYAKDDLDEDDIEVRVGDEEDVGIEEFDFEDSKDDAEDTATIKVEKRPAANDSIVVHIKSDGAEKIVNIWDEAIEEDVESTTATPDTANPTFDDIIAFEDSQFIIAVFSEPVNTTGMDEDEDDGERIEVGIANDEVRVSGERADGSPMPTIGGDGIAPVDRDEEQETLRIEIDRVIPEGAEITVSFGAEAGEQIVDRAKNRLAGTYTRTATAVEGPTLADAYASDLGANIDEQTQTFEITLVGDMDEDAELTICLDDPADKGVSYHALSNRYDVEGADGDVSFSSADNMITFEPDENISDGTTIMITAEDVDTTGTDEDTYEDLEVVFERSEIGATATAEFDILAGLSALSIYSEYDRMGDPEDEDEVITVEGVLASGQDGHRVTFGFELEGALEDGDAVEIDVSELADTGVTFDDEFTTDDDVEVELDNNVIVITPDNDEIEGVIEVTAKDVSVDTGSAAEDVAVTFTRTDSGLSLTRTTDIEASFYDMYVTNISGDPDQSLWIEFTLDGERPRGGSTARINLDESEVGLGFDDAEAEAVYEGSASISDAGIVTYTAPLGGLDDGTEVVIEVIDIDASGITEDTVVKFERRPGGFQASVVLEID